MSKLSRTIKNINILESLKNGGGTFLDQSGGNKWHKCNVYSLAIPWNKTAVILWVYKKMSCFQEIHDEVFRYECSCVANSQIRQTMWGGENKKRWLMLQNIDNW